MLGYIYKITNLINGKLYIGLHSKSDYSLVTLDNRYWASGIKINKAFNKYGKKNFSREILCWCNTLEELNALECYYIEKFSCLDDSIGYNIACGGKAGNLITSYSEEEIRDLRLKIASGNKKAWLNLEIREKYLKAFANRGNALRNKISKSLIGHKGHPMSEENKLKLRERSLGNTWGLGNKSRTGQITSEDTKIKLSEAGKKVTHTKEWNKKVSDALKGKPKSESHKRALRKPKPKFYWKLPDNSIRVMDAANGSKHAGWIKMELVQD